MRIFFVHHITWSVNSVCHFLGTRRFQTDDHSTNVVWLALPSLGESWHHNHHAFPRSASHGLTSVGGALDPSALVITGLEKVGLAHNVVRIAPERQDEREHQAPPLRAAAPASSLADRRTHARDLRNRLAGLRWRVHAGALGRNPVEVALEACGRDDDQVVSRCAAEVCERVRNAALCEHEIAGTGREQLVPHLEGQLSLQDAERLVEVVDVQGRAGAAGGPRRLDDGDAASSLLTPREDGERVSCRRDRPGYVQVVPLADRGPTRLTGGAGSSAQAGASTPACSASTFAK